MIRGLYTVGTGMLTQRKKLDVLANNLANVDTAGFKQDKLLTRSFQDVLIRRIGDSAGKNEVGPYNYGLHTDAVATDFIQGPLDQTDRMLDLAIEGEGFFAVNTEDGIRYTRAGAFRVDENLRIVTTDGYPLLGTNGEPFVLASEDVQIDKEGNVYNEGVYINTIQLTNFTNVEGLRKIGDNLYEALDDAGAVAANARVHQGFLEGSNVDLVKQMTDMIEISRSYETHQRMASIINDTLGKAVNEIGSKDFFHSLYIQDPSSGTVIDGVNATEIGSFSSGKLKGYMDMRDGDSEDNKGIPYYIRQLDTFVENFVEKFNEVHRSGWSYPNLSEGVLSQTGIDFFDPNGLTASTMRVNDAIVKNVYSIAGSSEEVNQLINSGNNENILSLLELRDGKNVLGFFDFEEYLRSVSVDLGTQAAYANNMEENEGTVLAGIDYKRQSVSGVDMDEEMTNMIRYEKAYQASARLMTALDEMLEILINKTGLVGR
jgi:flagellar basal-body rod protein FlgF